MSGPIVRSGPSPGFTKNWDSVFGSKKKAAPKPSAAPAKKKSAESKKVKSKGKKRGGKK